MDAFRRCRPLDALCLESRTCAGAIRDLNRNHEFRELRRIEPRSSRSESRSSPTSAVRGGACWFSNGLGAQVGTALGPGERGSDARWGAGRDHSCECGKQLPLGSVVHRWTRETPGSNPQCWSAGRRLLRRTEPSRPTRVARTTSKTNERVGQPFSARRTRYRPAARELRSRSRPICLSIPPPDQVPFDRSLMRETTVQGPIEPVVGQRLAGQSQKVFQGRASAPGLRDVQLARRPTKSCDHQHRRDQRPGNALPWIVRARVRALVRRSASSSPSWATVSCTIFPFRRTDRTKRP
jgi:hypothetical protein